MGKFSLQGFEHKNKISKEDFHIGTSKGGGNNPTFEHQMLNRDVVRFMLHSHPDVALPYELTSKGNFFFII